MKLTELQIQNFGKLHERRISLTEGINLIYGPNESGKTTLHTFIRGMFYGITRKRGRASRNDIYSRYEPWEDSGTYAGMLRFESGGKIFRINRSFSKGNGREELVCESDGEKLSIEQGDLNVLMGNVSENAFENTVFIGQMKSQTDGTLYEELRNYMVNYEETSDGDLDISKASNLLKAQKKEIEGRQKLELLQQENLRKELTSKIEYVQEELLAYQSQLTQINKDLRKEPKETVRPREEQQMKVEQPLWLYGAVLTVIFILIGQWQSNLLLKTGSMISALLCLGAGILLQLNQKQKNCQPQTAKAEDAVSDEYKHLIWKQEQLNEQCDEKETTLSNLQEEYREFGEAVAGNRSLDEELQALQLAMDTIETISARMQTSMEQDIKKEMSAVLSELTGGRYTAAEIDADHNLALHTADHYIPLERTSRGTIEQVYFSLRMAVSKILCVQERLPVMLDEVFAMYDEDRLKMALEWLAKNQQQTLIFTCHRREEEILKAVGLHFNKIEL